MPSIDELIIGELHQDDYKLWRSAFTAAVTRILAREVLASFDPTLGRFLRRFPPINDLRWRVRVLDAATDLQAICELRLMDEFDALNEAITKVWTASGVTTTGERSRACATFSGACAAPTAAPVSSEIVALATLIDVWRATADELARRVHTKLLDDAELPHSTLHNELLIAGYFWSAIFRCEALIKDELEKFAASMLSVQGTLLEIVERVSPDGVLDCRLPIVGTSVAFSLHHQSLSPLLESLVDESSRVLSGQGFLMRWLGAIKTEASAGVDPALMQRLRASAYRQYEYSVLAVMALSAIEQILRAFAHRVGLFEGQKRFTPARLAAIIAALGNSADVEKAINSVYDNEQGNLRNRVLHGAQLQIARSQQQSTISIVNPALSSNSPDALSPENIFNICREALQTLDHHIAKLVTLSAADLLWTRHSELKALRKSCRPTDPLRLRGRRR